MSKQVKGKLKSMFAKKPTSASIDERSIGEVIITKEILKEVSNAHNVIHRVRALKDLSEIVTAKIMEDHEIEAVLKTINDLLNVSISTEGRQAALQFLIALTNGQYPQLKMLRSYLFRIVVEHDINEDLQFRIALLKVLTDDGKDISYCEQIGAFLDKFMEEALESPNSVAFLHLLVQIIHYNSSFLDKDIVCSIVCKTCEFCNNTNGEQDVESCLQLLDATVRYGALPSEGLFPLIETLCRTVNIEKFCQASWKLMRNLIGTKLGHTAVFIMCKILEDYDRILDVILLRGAVFFIGMSIWGSKRVSTLSYKPIHVLSSLKIALRSNNHLVAHEVMLSLQRLIKKYGADQEYITWDIIMDIIDMLLKMLKFDGSADSHTQVHSLLTSIEQLYREEKFDGSTEKLFKIVTSCANNRPEDSIAVLLDYYEEKIDPNYEDWLEVFEMVLQKYLHEEKRSSVRVKVLEMTGNIYERYRYGYYEEEILSLILPKYIGQMAFERDKMVRLGVAKLLSCILGVCTAEKYSELLGITDKFLSYICNSTEDLWGNLEDIELTVDALIAAFRTRLFEPSNVHVGGMFKILIKHINEHYNCNVAASVTGGGIRRKIFVLLLSMCANQHHFMGITSKDDGDDVKYSVHAIFKPRDHCDMMGGGSDSWIVDCDFQMEFEAILKCLKNELDWNVLEYVLTRLPRQLKNKNLYLYCKCNMNKLCSTLCTLINDKMYLNKIQNCPASFGVSELRNLIFPILSTLSTYHDHLSRERQLQLVRCVEFGLHTRCAHTCVSCLTVCVLEMQTVMLRMLPSILVKLSQISATELLSIPILQFLSTLKEIPLLYTNFIEEQYMSIFAMALQYTDCERFSQYIVTIAHQVIADWFTRCRLVYRKGFVKLIAKALKSSLPVTVTEEHNDSKNDNNLSSTQKLHKEMTDVCLDMMARYSFSSHFGQHNRSSFIDSMLSKGTSQTWLMENMLVTITTSSPENRVCSCAHCMQVNSACHKKFHVYDEEITSMSTFQSINTSDIEEIKTDLKETKEEGIVEESGSAVTTSNASTGEINIVAGTLDDTESLCDEEGCEPTPLVVKLTQQLVEQGNAFSPSERLMFSRQASRVLKSENAEGEHVVEEEEDEDEESSESEDEIVQDGILSKISNPDTGLLEIPVFLMEECNDADVLIEQHHHRALEGSHVVQEQPPMQSEIPPDPLTLKQHVLENQCQAECGGWAEILIQRPTGKTSWVMRMEKKENIADVTLSELSLLTRSMEGAQIFDRIGSFLQPLSKLRVQDHHPRSVSESSSKSSSDFIRPLRRRFSTGSIDDAIIQQHSEKSQENHDTLDDEHFVNTAKRQVTVVEKRPLAKSYSQPSSMLNQNSIFKRRRSSSVITERPMFKTTTQAAPKPVAVAEKAEEASWCPNFVFLQLFYSSFGNIYENMPILLETNEAMERALKILDRIPAFNTHKFGVLYANKGQEQNEAGILSNAFGSVRYTDFISGLGDLINLKECDTSDYFTGGLSHNGEDGKFAYIWKDDTTQVIFHVATLMPQKESDEKCISKKLHIGNNFVTIIYDNTKHGYVFGTIKGQFNLAEILIRPLEYNSSMVTVRFKGNKKAGDCHVISDKNLPILVRQLAIHTNMALVTDQNNPKTTNAFASNWLERLRQIKRIKNKVLSSTENSERQSFDFTLYT